MVWLEGHLGEAGEHVLDSECKRNVAMLPENPGWQSRWFKSTGAGVYLGLIPGFHLLPVFSSGVLDLCILAPFPAKYAW